MNITSKNMEAFRDAVGKFIDKFEKIDNDDHMKDWAKETYKNTEKLDIADSVSKLFDKIINMEQVDDKGFNFDPENEENNKHLHTTTGSDLVKKLREQEKDYNKTMNDSRINQEIERPSHYGSISGQDVIDVAIDFGLIDNAFKFNILKYLCRGGKKRGNSELQDMLKIKVYLDRYIEELRKDAQ